MQQFCG
ncbi:hypothetical protein CP8484711_1085A, partial [Chlamydia psittaci 84-8471/1]